MSTEEITINLHSNDNSDNETEVENNPLAQLIVPSETDENIPKISIEGTLTYKDSESSSDSSDDEGIEINPNQIVDNGMTKQAKRIKIGDVKQVEPVKEEKRNVPTVVTDDFWGKPITYQKKGKGKKKEDPDFVDEKQFEADLLQSDVQKEEQMHLIITDKTVDDEFEVVPEEIQTEKLDLELIKQKLKLEEEQQIASIIPPSVTQPEIPPETHIVEEIPILQQIKLTDLVKEYTKVEPTTETSTEKAKEPTPVFKVDEKINLDDIVEEDEEENADESTVLEDTPKELRDAVFEPNHPAEDDAFILREQQLNADQLIFEQNSKVITFGEETSKQTVHQKDTKPEPSIRFCDIFIYFTNVDKSKYQNSIVTDDVSSYGCFTQFCGLPKLRPQLQQTLDNIFLIAKMPINDNEPQYLLILQTLFQAITGSNQVVSRFGEHWVQIGFQGSDPATDIRDAGTLSLLQLLFLCETNKTLVHDLYILSTDTKQNFPLCCVGINITLHLLKFLRSRHLYRICNAQNNIIQAMNILFCACMKMFYKIWKEENLTIEKFQYALECVTTKAEKHSEIMVKEYKV